MKGAEIKAKVIAAGLKLYEVADEIGITETSFSRKLRKDFNEKDTEKVLKAIEKLKKA